MSFLENITAWLPFNKRTEKTEYFFAVCVGLSEVTSTVWGLMGNQIDILGQKTYSYNGTDDLVEKTHLALDDSLGALDIEPEKVLFGVPESWSMDDNLKEPYLKLLNKMLKEYDLSPLAYVTTTNSLAYLLQKQEGSPPTTILLGLGDFIEITLVKGGKIMGTKITKRTDILFEDIEKMLQQFTEVEVLPSKILLYSTTTNEDLSKMQGELMSYPWMAKLSFLHFPKIEILADDILYQSVIFAGCSELYPEIDLKHNFSLYQPVTPTFSDKTPHVQSFHSMSSDSEIDSGFVKGDIKKSLERDETEVEGDKEEAVEFTTKPRKLKNLSAEEEEDLEDDNLISPQLPGRMIYNKFLLRLTSMVPRISFSKKIPLRGSLLSKILMAVVIVGVLGVGYFFLFKASVNIWVEPRILEKETQVIADPKVTQIDEANKIIPGTVIETTVTGSDKGNATGTKQVGDPAKGKVIIYNRTAAAVSIPLGTVLTSASNLKFTLDSAVSIASQSSSLGADYVKQDVPGKTSPVGITASVIGPESNLTGGTEMTIKGYTKDQVVANVDQALSGGTSKSVTVVTADDQKKLQASLTDTLRQKAEADLKGQSKDGKKVIADALAVADGKYTFSKQVNDQASDFTLNATIRFKGTSYLDSDLRTIVSKLVVVDIPANYEMNLQDAETQAEVAKVEKDGRLIFNARFTAKLLPKFNLEDIKKQIKGKNIIDAGNKLKELENVVGSEIILTPSLPGPLARLPFFTKNIVITVSPK